MLKPTRYLLSGILCSRAGSFRGETPPYTVRKGCLGMTVDPSLWQMVPGHSLCTQSSLSSGPLAVPDHGDGELVLL